MKAVILAAGIGKRLKPLTDTTPKCLIEINGRALINYYIELLNSKGIHEIAVVIGHLGDSIKQGIKTRPKDITFIYNPDYTLGNVTSLYAAREFMQGECLLMDADVYFEPDVLGRLINSQQKNCFLLDAAVQPTGEEMMLGAVKKRAIAISRNPQGKFDLTGEGVGFVRLGAASAKNLISLAKEFIDSGKTNSEYEECLQELIKKDYFGYEVITGLKWTEIDFPEDIKKAQRLFKED